MPVTPEASARADKMLQHIKEVEAGLIPTDSPPDFVRADWKADENGLPGWFGPVFHPTERAIDAYSGGQAETGSDT